MEEAICSEELAVVLGGLLQPALDIGLALEEEAKEEAMCNDALVVAPVGLGTEPGSVGPQSMADLSSTTYLEDRDGGVMMMTRTERTSV